METKEFKIQVPEGYEIDKENSTFECIKFKPLDKKLTYEDVAKTLFCDDECWYIDEYAHINRCCDGVTEHVSKNPINCTSKKQAEKLIAINKLMNVAKYLNTKEKRRKDGVMYYIKDNRGILMSDWTVPKDLNCGEICFNSYELAKKAIDILGEDTIRTALSTDW